MIYVALTSVRDGLSSMFSCGVLNHNVNTLVVGQRAVWWRTVSAKIITTSAALSSAIVNHRLTAAAAGNWMDAAWLS